MASPAGWIRLAEKLILANGRVEEATFTRVTRSGRDTQTLSYANETTITYTAPVAPVDFKMLQIDGVTVLIGQKMLYVPGGIAQTPVVKDTVDLGGKVYKVLEVIAYETQSVNCAYLLKIGV